MKRKKMDLYLFAIVLTGILSTAVAVISKVQGDKAQKAAESKVAELQTSLAQETISLANLLLMKDYVTSTVRAVFRFDNPINVLPDSKARKFKEKNLPPTPSIHQSRFPTQEGAYNLYTANRQPSSYGCASITADLGTLGKFNSHIFSGFAGPPSFVYYEDTVQHAAFELWGGDGDAVINLARLYTQLKQPTNSITLRKNYPAGFSKDSIIAEEKRFANEKVTVSFECSIIEEKGIWYKVNLVLENPKQQYVIRSDHAAEGDYFFTEHKWIVEKNNNGFVFNKVESVTIQVSEAKEENLEP